MYRYSLCEVVVGVDFQFVFHSGQPVLESGIFSVKIGQLRGPLCFRHGGYSGRLCRWLVARVETWIESARLQLC
jgi:hypothetical protein